MTVQIQQLIQKCFFGLHWCFSSPIQEKTLSPECTTKRPTTTHYSINVDL